MSVQDRVEELLAKMTPAEKAGQLTQYFYFRLPEGAPGPVLDFDPDEQPRMVESMLRHGGAGSLLFLTDPAEINRLQRLAVEGNRFGIPVLIGFDVIHGLRTIFPVPIAMAASWDPETIEAGQAVAAREARAVGIHWAFAPMSTSPATRGGGGSSKGPARIRTSARGWPPRRSEVSRARRWVRPSGSLPVPSTSPGTAMPSAAATTTR